MGRIKYTPENKVEIIRAFKSRKVSYSMLKERYGMEPCEIYKWIKRYEEQGISAFARGIGNSKYTQEFKIQCVEEYLREGSLDTVKSQPGTALAVCGTKTTVQVGDTVTLDMGGRPEQLRIAGILFPPRTV